MPRRGLKPLKTAYTGNTFNFISCLSIHSQQNSKLAVVTICKEIENCGSLFWSVFLYPTHDLQERIHKLANEMDPSTTCSYWDEVDRMHPRARVYLDNVGDELWMSSAFGRRRYGLAASNPVEISSAWIKSNDQGQCFKS